jgi:signal transduction histidine kinase
LPAAVTTQATILAVDDNAANVRLLEAVLVPRGYAVVGAASGADALMLVAGGDIDLVLLDILMPAMDGYEVCRRLRANALTETLPVVMITSAGSREKLRALDSGADDFITKPFDQSELLARVKSLLRVKHYLDVIHAQAAELAEWNRTLEARVADQVRELRASRARIVAAADLERRRIERDLHDGAQQRLVALALNLGLARDLVTSDPRTARDKLDELSAGLMDAIAELRDLAHGIYPTLLVEGGLPDALEAAADRSCLGVRLDAVAVGRYSGEVEAAVYFCCLEALQNVGKHAAGAQVVVTVCEEAGVLRFEVADDGPGFDVDMVGRGQGGVNMADRLGAVGGQIHWDSAPGRGTRVSGTLPLGESVHTQLDLARGPRGVSDWSDPVGS